MRTKVDPARLADGDVCDVEVRLTLKDGTEVRGLALGGSGESITVKAGAEYRDVPLASVASAVRT